MAGFEYGEELICMEKVKIGSITIPQGDIFPYIDLNVDPALVDSLLGQRKVARSLHLSKTALENPRKVRVEKIIKNFPDGRVALSWPVDEPLPGGVIDGRPSALKISPRVESKPEQETESDLSDEEFEDDTDHDKELGQDGENYPEHPEVKADSVKIVPADGIGWFNVEVDGIVVNTKKLRKKEALKLSDEYR